MTLMEPVGRPVEVPVEIPVETALVNVTVGPSGPAQPLEDPLPKQREPVADAAELAVDHVHRHAKSCFWDFRVARWECGRD